MTNFVLEVDAIEKFRSSGYRLRYFGQKMVKVPLAKATINGLLAEPGTHVPWLQQVRPDAIVIWRWGLDGFGRFQGRRVNGAIRGQRFACTFRPGEQSAAFAILREQIFEQLVDGFPQYLCSPEVRQAVHSLAS